MESLDTGGWYQICKEKMIPILHNFLYITPILKTDKDMRERKLESNIFYEHRCKTPQHNIANLKPTISKVNCTPWPTGIYSRSERLAQHSKINQRNPPHQQDKE